MNIKEAIQRAVAECRSYKGNGEVFIENVIPTYADLTPEEQAGVDTGAPWPVRIRTVEIPESECRLVEAVMALGVAGGAFVRAGDDQEEGEVTQ